MPFTKTYPQPGILIAVATALVGMCLFGFGFESLMGAAMFGVTYQKIDDFVLQLGKGVHQLHAAGHTVKVYLSNAAPTAASDTIKSTSTATEITMTNEGNHGAGGGDVANDFTEASGTASLTGTDVVFAASGGTVGPFRYVVMYNDTQTSPADPLIAYWDYGSSLTLQDGETFTVDFGASIFTLT